MISTILRLGKLWKEKPKSRPHNVHDNHPYIAEYETTLEKAIVKEEVKPKPKKKGKRY